MGITGLLPLLKKASTNCNVKRLSGCTVAIDAYCWLHKGAFGCAAQLGKGEPTTAYITYCLKYINVLLSHNIKPILVLDGRNLPSKASTEKKRRGKRELNRKNAKEFLRKGMNKEAWECFTRCVDITPAMAREFIKVLRDMKIDYIVAPYEADAQLAYLARNNIVDVVITEDSDLVLFGCPKIFFKMNVNGDGVLFDQSKINICMDLKPDQFQFERFRWMCILSGCDYLPSLPGVGLGRAKKLINGITGQDISKIIKEIPGFLRLDIDVTEEYLEGFERAENTFLYQLVFDTISRQLVPLTPYTVDVDPKELKYAGSYVDQKLALDMALGNIDIHTLEKVDSFDPRASNSGYTFTSIWSTKFTTSNVRKIVTARDMKNATKHTPTVGMITNISLKSSVKKRQSVDRGENVVEDDSKEILSMYTFHEESASGNVKKENSIDRGTKRIRLDTDVKYSLRRKNPFLKSPKSPQSILKNEVKTDSESEPEDKEIQRYPVCLIERNKIYQDQASDGKIIVKSQYFRSKINSTRNKSSLQEPLVFVKSHTSNLYFETDSSEEEENLAILPSDLDINKELKCAESQLTIYSLRPEAEAEPYNGSQELPQTDIVSVQDLSIQIKEFEETVSVINIEDDDLLIASEKKQKSPEIFRTARNSANKRAKNSSCRRVGLSKTSGKSDPKQRSIAALFAVQQKPKL